MKKQKRPLKELFALAKGKPASCCEVDPPSKDKEAERSSDKCCATNNENSCG